MASEKSTPEKEKTAGATAENGQGEKKSPKPKADSEQQRLKKEEQARTGRRRTRQLIGLALAILIVVGAVSIVMSAVELVGSMLDNTDEREAYQKLYEPLVWFEILPFESVTQVEENNLKQVAIWGVLNSLSEEDISRTDRGEPMVSAAEVDAYGVKLFGPDFRFSAHASFGDPLFGLSYVFDEETQMYVAPSTSLMPRYLATVVDIQRESGGVRRVVMGYVATTTSDNQLIATPDYEHPARYMDYMLRRDGNSYYLYAIENNTTYEVTQTDPTPSVDMGAPLPDSSLPPEQPASVPQSKSDADTDASGTGEDTSADETDEGDASAQSGAEGGDSSAA